MSSGGSDQPGGEELELKLADQDYCELNVPDIKVAEELPIVVLTSGDPTNFLFRPCKFDSDLNELEAEMAAYYNANTGEDLKVDRVLKNKAYAARLCSGKWYRVVVTDELLRKKVVVRLCDYGELTVASLSSLRELKPEFKKHPIMAMRGRLAGVRPLGDTWLLEDNERFMELTRDVVGTVTGIIDSKQNLQCCLQRIVYLHLTTTRHQNNAVCDISQIFVEENRAFRDG